MKLIKSILFLFLLTYCTHSFAKSSEYYRATLVHVLTECNSECKKQVFEVYNWTWSSCICLRF